MSNFQDDNTYEEGYLDGESEGREMAIEDAKDEIESILYDRLEKMMGTKKLDALIGKINVALDRLI